MKKHYSFVKDNLRNFYTTGFEMNNNISVRTGNEKMGLSFLTATPPLTACCPTMPTNTNVTPCRSVAT